MYCGSCDTRHWARPFHDRPVSRVTCWSYCSVCRKKIPSCRACAEGSYKSRGCGFCGAAGPRVDFDSREQLDSDDDDRGDNTSDVRIACPRFTPLSRTQYELPEVWTEDKTRPGWWIPNEGRATEQAKTLRCTGCDVRTRFRCPANVMMVIDGGTHRLQHLLCGGCIRCVENRLVSIQAATLGTRVTALDITLAPVDTPQADIKALDAELRFFRFELHQDAGDLANPLPE